MKFVKAPKNKLPLFGAPPPTGDPIVTPLSNLIIIVPITPDTVSIFRISKRKVKKWILDSYILINYLIKMWDYAGDMKFHKIFKKRRWEK